jgi:hypothetical protein
MVRIHLPPAVSPSLSPSCCRGSRTPAFRAAARGWLGDRVGRDTQGVYKIAPAGGNIGENEAEQDSNHRFRGEGSFWAALVPIAAHTNAAAAAPSKIHCRAKLSPSGSIRFLLRIMSRGLKL